MALALIQESAIVMGLGIFRLQPDRFVEILKRLVVASLLAVDDAAADIGRGIRRVDRQRLVLIGQRLIALVDPAVYKRAIGIGLRVIGIEADRLVEVGQRLLGPAGFAIDRTPHVVSLWIVRMRGDDFAERSDIGLRAGIERLVLVGGARTAGSGTAGEGDEHRGQHYELRYHVRYRLGRSAAHCGARITARTGKKPPARNDHVVRFSAALRGHGAKTRTVKAWRAKTCRAKTGETDMPKKPEPYRY